MQCPVDGATLQMSERGGVEIDYCPTCRGVWLDRGELDKIIAKSVEAEAAAAPAPPPPATQAAPQPQAPPAQPGAPWGQPAYPPQYSQGYDPRYGHKGYKRKKSFLEEIFD
jgi:Zn-finger nucleic acid-binding protein